MSEQLIGKEGSLKGSVLNIPEESQLFIGNDPSESQLVIDDPSIRSQQLLLQRTEEGLLIENVDPADLLEINGEIVIIQPHFLEDGDLIKIGEQIFLYDKKGMASVTTLPQENALPSPSIEDDAFEEDTDTSEDASDTFLGDTLIDEKNAPLAEINFDIAQTGRWLLKVIGGPNNGAEFYMQAGESYLLGTDPLQCDIIFQDTSVSRQHARITVSNEDVLEIEDLKSRNGIQVGGIPIQGKQTLKPSSIVTMGTTSFVVYDREGEMETIISPLLPSIVKTLQEEEPKDIERPFTKPPEKDIGKTQEELPPAERSSRTAYIFIGIVVGLFLIAGLGTVSLFQSEPVVAPVKEENATELIQQAINPFPGVKFSFNQVSGGLLLTGHVLTQEDKNQLLYNLQGLKFIKSIDPSGIIIDQYVWQEINSILANNPQWKGITIHSPSAGQFILSGYLKTRQEAEALNNYLNRDFSYGDLLQNQVVVEENVIETIKTWLRDAGLNDVQVQMEEGEVTLSGSALIDQKQTLSGILARIKKIPGVRFINNFVRFQTREKSITNLSSQYQVSGQSRIGNRYTLIINGRIVSQGDTLDGMVIKRITSDTVFLEKDGNEYRIDY